METSIRFLRVNGRSVKPALCFRGRNQAHAVINDESAIRVVSNIPLRKHDEAALVMGPAGFGATMYPIGLFVKRFKEIGERKGMTRRAIFLLERAESGGVSDDDELPPDEPEDLLGKGLPEPKPDETVDDYVKRSEPKRKAEQPDASGKRSASPASPAKAASKAATKPVEPSGAAPRTAGSDVVRKLAIELKLEPPKLRKLLRSKGLRAPYTDEAAIRKAIGK